MTSPGLMRALAAEREREIASRTWWRRPLRSYDGSRTARLRGRLAFTALGAADANGAR